MLPASRPLRLVIIAVTAGLLAFVLTRQFAPAPTASPGDELAWVTREFELTPAQAARVQALHDAYRPVCARHCAAILAAQAELAAAGTPAERTAIAAHLRELTATCHNATLAHLEAVAAVMPPAQGQRYLALIQPRLSSHQHTAPFGLR